MATSTANHSLNILMSALRWLWNAHPTGDKENDWPEWATDAVQLIHAQRAAALCNFDHFCTSNGHIQKLNPMLHGTYIKLEVEYVNLHCFLIEIGENPNAPSL